VLIHRIFAAEAVALYRRTLVARTDGRVGEGEEDVALEGGQNQRCERAELIRKCWRTVMRDRKESACARVETPCYGRVDPALLAMILTQYIDNCAKSFTPGTPSRLKPA